MNVRWRESQRKPVMPRVAFEKHKIRAELYEQVDRRAKEYEEKRWEELNAYANAVDATVLYTLHEVLGLGKQRLRRIWEEIIRNRVEFRLFFRDGGDYQERKTGDNIEDRAIRDALLHIGVDILAWEDEEIIVDEQTKEVRFRGK